MFPWYSHTIPEYHGNIMGMSMSILSAGSLEVGRFFVDCLHESNDWMKFFFFNEIFYGTIMGQWG